MQTILHLIAMIAIALGALSGDVLAQEKKKKKSEGAEMTYERKLPPNYAPFGPYYVTNYQGGNFFEGRVSIAIEAIDVPARSVVWSNKPLVNGILQPLAVKLFEQGRPTPSRVEAFKKEAAKQLDARFKDKIKGIYVREVMG
jgi:hypothetical protein